MADLVELKSIVRSFGGLRALKGVDFAVRAGEVAFQACRAASFPIELLAQVLDRRGRPAFGCRELVRKGRGSIPRIVKLRLAILGGGVQGFTHRRGRGSIARRLSLLIARGRQVPFELGGTAFLAVELLPQVLDLRRVAALRFRELVRERGGPALGVLQLGFDTFR